MKNRSLLYYKIGLAAIGVFVVTLLVIVLSQASANKQDQNTYNKAISISTSLQNYIDRNNKLPDNLAQAGATNVPSTISYTKLSNYSFKFCVTYKASSSSFDPSSVTSNLINSSISNTVGSSDTGSYLTIGANYHKGLNCQTITDTYLAPPGRLYIGGSSLTNSSSSGSYSSADINST